MFDQGNLYGCATDLGLGGRKCCRVGDALQPFASVWVRRRKLPSTQVLFIALPAPSCDFTWPDIPPRPPRCGREATGPPTPRSTRRGVASTADPREPRRPLVGRRSNGPQTVAPSPGRSGSSARLAPCSIVEHPRPAQGRLQDAFGRTRVFRAAATGDNLHHRG
jgi:hypothetical protein